MMQSYRYVICDVFTEQPLAGNPLAVFTDARGLAPATMQALAREMNLSETVFVLPPASGGHARIRVFTPTQEIPFAGHPTLGAAFVLAAPLQRDELRLETDMGLVLVRLIRDLQRIHFGWMIVPVPKISAFSETETLLAALGVRSTELPIERYDNGPQHVMVTVASAQEVATLRPNFGALAKLPPYCFSVFALTGPARAKTRMFAPGAGILEDPGTGSAAGPLVAHLARHERAPFGQEIIIEQGGEIGRPSVLHARVAGSAASLEQIEVGGAAVIVARGEFRIRPNA